MTKPTFETPSLTQSNIEKIAALFPSAITEAVDDEKSAPEAKVYKKAINFEALKQLLTDEALGGNEAYEFTWVGKKASIVEANKPIRKTLRPCKEESRDWETTQNLYIEGDNLEVLKLLQESYLGKVKMIYIDPPYNTGNDFVYRDDFRMDKGDYDEEAGIFDEEENRLFRNKESNGRFHSDWCSMIYPRLMLARNLLSDDGVIFISIDDNEVVQLRKICDEVFGEGNFVAQITVVNNPRGRQSDTFVATTNEFLFCYAKNVVSCKLNGLPLTDGQKAEYSFCDKTLGAYRLLGLRQRGSASLRADRPDMYFPIYVNSSTEEISLIKREGWDCILPRKSDGRDGRWMWGREKCNNESFRLVARRIERRNEYDIFVKDFLSRGDSERTRKFSTVWDDKGLNNQAGTQEVKQLLQGDYMSFPKSRQFIQNICQMGSTAGDIILDFFSGSATTAHAVMQLNAEDGGNRKFIMVQLPEPCEKDSEAFKARYKNICEIGKERIRRAGNKIKEDAGLNGQNLDIGFRVFKVDSTNMKDVYYGVGEYEQKDLDGLVSNIKDDRTDLDLLYGCILEWGLELSYPHKTESIDGFNVHIVNDDPAGATLIVCFDTDISEKALVAIAKQKPLRVVFRDSSFASSPAKINVFELFKLHAPDTEVKVI